jgi:hypothetical protein
VTSKSKKSNLNKINDLDIEYGDFDYIDELVHNYFNPISQNPLAGKRKIPSSKDLN